MTGSGVSYRKTKPTSHAHVAAPGGGLGAVWQLILNQIPPRARNPQPNPEKRAQNPTVVKGMIFTEMTGSGGSYRKTNPTSHAHVPRMT